MVFDDFEDNNSSKTIGKTTFWNLRGDHPKYLIKPIEF
jgi:hypothetical protein